MAVKPERREAALMYAELRNFTRLSEVLQPDKVLELANEFFSFVSRSAIAGAFCCSATSATVSQAVRNLKWCRRRLMHG